MAKTKLKKKIKIEPSVRSITKAYPENFGALGKRIEFGAKSKVTFNSPGMEVKFFTTTVDVLIGIGKDHTANLIMDIDAWKALNKGDKIHIDTLQEFKEKFL
jgi:hypothetical protein